MNWFENGVSRISNGWNSHNGEYGRPYIPFSTIDVKFRDGEIWYDQLPQNLWWIHENTDNDIIAWRLSIYDESV